MGPVIIDTLEEHLGKVYVAGIAGTGMLHPPIYRGDYAIFYIEPKTTRKPTMLLTPRIEPLHLKLVERGEVLLVIPKPAIKDAEKWGLKIDGILLYGTRNFWVRLTKRTPAERYVDVIYKQFKGHISSLRVIGKLVLGAQLIPLDYQNTFIYYDYGLSESTVTLISEINTELLLKWKPITVKVSGWTARQLELIHPESVTRINESIRITAFF